MEQHQLRCGGAATDARNGRLMLVSMRCRTGVAGQ